MQIGNNNFDTKYKMEDRSGNNVDIQKIDHEKYLGINFTSTLSFDQHISSTVNKVNSHIYRVTEKEFCTYGQASILVTI